MNGAANAVGVHRDTLYDSVIHGIPTGKACPATRMIRGFSKGYAEKSKIHRLACLLRTV